MENPPPPILRIRLTAGVAFVFSAAAFVLTLLAALSGAAPGMLADSDLLTLNSSKVGQNIIRFTPATTTTPKRSSILDPLGLFPSGTASASAAGATATGGAQGILGEISSIFNAINGAVQNITSDLDGVLTNGEAELGATITKALGINDYYSLHMNSICMGSYTNSSNPQSTYNTSRCMSYSNATSGLSNLNIPSSIKIATTNVSAPILSSVSGAGGVVGTATTVLTKAVFAFFIISLVGSGVSTLGSLAGIILLQNRILIYINGGFSSMGLLFHFIGSIAATATIAAINAIANSVGNNVGLNSIAGTKFLIFVWISFALVLFSSTYWVAIWFVEFRRHSLKVRRRTPEQIGNWQGVVREVLGDFRSDKEVWDAWKEIDGPPGYF